MKTIATTLGVARSNLRERVRGTDETRAKPDKAKDAAVLHYIREPVATVATRPTYCYRRTTGS